MGTNLDYDDFATSYARNRWAPPWVCAPLFQEAARQPASSAFLEIGCGTANYLHALARQFPQNRYMGFDVSEEMLRIAKDKAAAVELCRADAERPFPCLDGTFRLVFAVDVVHYIRNLECFFQEAARILCSGGRFLVVTDSGEDLRRRSLTTFFPEVLEIEIGRYPQIATLNEAAAGAGLRIDDSLQAEGHVALDDPFVAKLEQKCSSALRLISPEAHSRGITRVRLAQKQGGSWLSSYTVLSYEKP